MTVNDYPEFAEGQTLTAGELNQLTEHLRDRDAIVASMIGFGINAGLGASFSGANLTVQPGMAIDQNGEPLVLREAATFGFARTPDAVVYPFIETAPGGFSVVLEARDEATPPPPCTETDCAGHATVHATGVRLRVVAGRVQGARFDFSGEPLLQVEPMRLSQTSQPVGSYVALRDAIVARLLNGTAPSLVADALITALQGTSIAASDLPGVKGYKAGWINMVLFAALDLLRAEALMRVGAFRSADPAGVVLGWVHQTGSTWVFDCAHRHAWEPPRGFSEAFFGGTCSDPCGLYRDQLEGLLAGYAPPDPPPTPPPATGGGGTIGPVKFCPHGRVLVQGKCIYVVEPPTKIPDKWHKWWIYVDPEVPIWNPPIKVIPQIEDLYEMEHRNIYQDGVLSVTGLLGFDKNQVKETLVKEITDVHGGVANVVIATAKEVTMMDGYMPASGASPSDRIVLVADDIGRVIATGRVAAVHTAKQVGTVVPKVELALDQAGSAVADVMVLSGTVETSLKTMDTRLGGFSTTLGGLQQEFLSFRGGAFDQAGYGTRLGALEQQLEKLGGVGERIATLEGRFAGRVTAGISTAPTLDVAVGAGIAEFTRTAVEAMKSIDRPDNQNLKRYIAAAEHSQAEFEVAISGGGPAEIGMAAVELLDTMRTMVKASGVDASLGRKLDAQFREVRGRFA